VPFRQLGRRRGWSHHPPPATEEAHDYSCEDAKVTYENYGTLAEAAQESDDLTGFNQAVAGATKTDEVAKAHGCSWGLHGRPENDHDPAGQIDPSARHPVAAPPECCR
jgi:hypothetical protein